MKCCTVCNEEKPETEFNFKNKKLNKRQSRCRVCQSEFHAKHYRKNKSQYLERALANNKIYRKRNIDYLREHKRKCGCFICGESEPVALDFHHVSDDKESNLSRLASNCISISGLEKEINKCVVLCSNCHRKVHAGILSLPIGLRR